MGGARGREKEMGGGRGKRDKGKEKERVAEKEGKEVVLLRNGTYITKH